MKLEKIAKQGLEKKGRKKERKKKKKKTLFFKFVLAFSFKRKETISLCPHIVAI